MSKTGPCVGDEGCSYGREWEDSPGPEVRARFEGGGPLGGPRVRRGRRDRPYPRLISARDRGIRSSSNSRHSRGGGSSRGWGDGSRRGRGPHARPVAVFTADLHHS